MLQITALKSQAKSPDRISVYLNHHFAFGLSQKLAAEEKLVIGDSLTAERIANLRRKSKLERYLLLAYRYLSYRPRSRKEMIDYLTRKGVGQEAVDEIVGDLEKKNYINDFDFALWWLDQRDRFRPRGRFLLINELKQKGLDPEEIDQALANIDEEKLIRQILAKKGTSFLKDRKKVIAHLCRRGFSWEAINKEVNKEDFD